MEENNRNNTPGEGAQNNEQHPGAGRSKRRGHRGGKRHHGNKKPENAANEEGAVSAPAAEAEKKPAGEQKVRDDRRQNNQNRNKNAQKSREANKTEGGNAEKEKNKNNRNDRRQIKKQNDRRTGRQDHIGHKDDIYGDPQEERELAEWRAKIVLNNAPASSAAPLAASQNPFAQEEAEEPVEIPEGIDLLGSTVTAEKPATDEEKVEVVGIRFRSTGKMYYFAPDGIKVKKGDYAIVETARGPEFGDVALENTLIPVSETVTPLRPLIRRATEADIQHNEENRAKEQEALEICKKKIAEHKLDMKLIDAQYAFDNSKLLFHFSSEGRVDFRELVKDLASVFRTRIELRQIGIRDEAKMLGGFGACGRLLCCSTFLPDFAQVSIKMAKEQGLSLNSAKISGTCGRLMCCLRFESEVYAAESKLTPSIHATVKTPDGMGTVISTNPLAGTVRVILKDTPDAPPKQYHRKELTVIGKKTEKAEKTGDEEESTE